MSHDDQVDIFSFIIAVTPTRYLDIGADAVDVAATVEVVAADVDVDFRFHLHTALFNLIDVSFEHEPIFMSH